MARQPGIETSGGSRPADTTNGHSQPSNPADAGQTAEIVSENPLNFEQTFWRHEGLVSDKWVQYLAIYEQEVGRVVARRGPVRLLEIGVQNGGSLQIWAKALPPTSQVVGIDIDPRCATLPLGEGVRVVVGDATDFQTVEQLFDDQLFDVIVDDGSHVSSDVIAAFFVCFPHLAPGGTYVIEDLHASYWASHGGGLRRPGSAMEFLKSLADALNADHFESDLGPMKPEAVELTELGTWIERITFYDSVVAVQKREASKRRPHGRAVAGLRAPIAPALDAILSVPSSRLDSVAVGAATGHALDMRMLEEVRRRRMQMLDLHEHQKKLVSEIEAERRETGRIREALQLALHESEAARQAAQVEAEAAREAASAELQATRQRALAEADTALQIAEREVSRARIERDNMRLQASRGIALTTALRDAALAERDAALARAAMIESSGFWRLTGPARRLINASPWLHRFGKHAVRLAHGIVHGRLHRRLPVVAAHDSTGPLTPVAAIITQTPANSVLDDPLFDKQHALVTELLPQDARRCLIVPFEMTPPASPVPRIGVMIHAFYPDQLNLILQRVAEIPGSPDLFVTTDTEDKRAQIEAELGNWTTGRFEVRVLPNRGRDIAPKLFGWTDVYMNYDLVLHLHTKKSMHSDRGGEWFNHLLQTLVGSERVVRSVLAAFALQPKLGMLIADHWDPVRGFVNWGYNYPIAQELAARMGFGLSRDEPLDFPSGSMFWARPSALAPLLALRLRPEHFPEEAGQVDGTIAHAIERLFLRVCEHAGHSWARIVHDEVYQGDAARALRIESAEVLENVLQRHPVLLADPALRTSVRVLPGRPDTWPMRIAAEFDERPRVNLLIPTFRRSSVFGGIATAHALFERVADALGPDVERRMILTGEDQPIDPSDLPEGWSLASPTDASQDRSAVLLLRGTRFEHGLPVRPRDVFFASAWWDAAAGHGVMDLQRSFFGRGARLRYFIQDYEPNFTAWSASWASAEETYHRPDDTVAMVNSHFLAEHLDSLGLRFADRHVFEPLWTQGLGRPGSDAAERENLLLVYWRPHVERNLGPVIASGLARWLEENPYSARHWTIIAVGEDGADVRLTNWRSMTSMGKLTLLQYTALLRRAKVGVALMLSPHPSYPPLEMAAFGMRVVTNRFGPKDLSRFGERIESVQQPTPAAIASAIARATAAWADGAPSATSFDLDAAFATEAQLNAFAAAVAERIRSEVGIGCPSVGLANPH